MPMLTSRIDNVNISFYIRTSASVAKTRDFRIGKIKDERTVIHCFFIPPCCGSLRYAYLGTTSGVFGGFEQVQERSVPH